MVNTSEEFGADNVTVTVEWTQEEGAVYKIIIVPQVPMTFIAWRLKYFTDFAIQYRVQCECGSCFALSLGTL